MISYLSYNLTAFLARIVPPPLARSITKSIALNQYQFRRKLRKTIAHNLRVVLGETTTESQIDESVRNVFVNFAHSIYCFLRLPRLTGSELTGCCNTTQAHDVIARLGQQGGFILAGPHVGPWEIGGACLSAEGLRIHTVAFEHPSRFVTRFFEDRRRQAGIECHAIGKSFGALVKALEKGDCVALLIDRDFRRGEKKYKLFGKATGLPGGHAVLAVRCSVPIVTAVCVFTDDDKFRLELRGPYHPDKSLSEDAAVDDLIEKCRLDIEWFVQKYPDQWFNFHPM